VLTCQDLIGLLLEYLEGTLGADVIAEFERHLEACAPCRAYLRTYQRTRELTAEVTHVEMPAELKTLLRELLRRQITAGPA
jgi:anti-sigma factor RsiW